MVVPQNRWSLMENPNLKSKMDDAKGYLHFRTPPYASLWDVVKDVALVKPRDALEEFILNAARILRNSPRQEGMMTVVIPSHGSYPLDGNNFVVSSTTQKLKDISLCFTKIQTTKVISLFLNSLQKSMVSLGAGFCQVSGKNHFPVLVKVSEHPFRLQWVMLLPLVSSTEPTR